MHFTDAAMLAGLAALAVPLAIHLLGRRRPTKLELPTARHAAAAHARQRGWLRVRRWGLLALRLMVVALLVLVLAGPYLGGAAAGRRATWAVHVDTSPSMRTAADGGTRLDRARMALGSVLEAARGRAGRVVVTTSDGPAFDGPPAEAPRDGLAAASWRSTPIGRAAREAVARARDGDGAVRFFVITDAAPWALRDLAPGSLADLGAPVTVTVVGAKVRNAWLDLPRAELPPEGGAPALLVEVDAVSATPTRGASVELRIEGAEARREALRPGLGRARFLVPLTGDGPWTGRARLLEADPLAVDDERFLVAGAGRAARVLVVDGAGAGAALHVLAAFPAGVPGARAKTTRIAPDAVTEARLAGADVVFWVGGGAPADAAAPRRYVEAGGGLVWLPDEPKGPPAALAGLVPGRVAGVEAPAEGVTLDPGGYRSDLLAAFEGGAAADLARPTLAKRLALEPDGAETAVRFMDGRPAILSAGVGRGRALTLAAGPTPTWGRLGGTGQWVVLLHSLLEAFVPGDRSANLVVGRDPGAAALGPGLHAVGGRPVAVNLAPDETAQLDPVPARLKAAFAPGRVEMVPPEALAARAAAFGPADADRADLTPWLAAALAGALAAEGYLAARASKGRRRPAHGQGGGA